MSKVEWVKKGIGLMRKVGEKRGGEGEIMDVVDDEGWVSESERGVVEVVGRGEKKGLEEGDGGEKKGVEGGI